jgi:hypothetical protein
MAIFKAPRISQPDRESIVLDPSEIVFDITLEKFFGGNGVTPGGNAIGHGAGSITETITINQSHLDNKKIVLSQSPVYPNSVTVIPMGGIPQLNGTDFSVSSNELSWDGLGLDGFIDLGDKIVIQY